MRYGYLSQHFQRIAAKKLALVETVSKSSNQHEFNGVDAVRTVLGTEEFKERSANFLWLGDENESVSDSAPVSWYDSRRNKPHRAAEWRLYFKSNAVMELAAAGDLLVIGLRPDGVLWFIVARQGSTLENQIAWLFGLDGELGEKFQPMDFGGAGDRGLDFIANCILEEIGIAPAEPEADHLDQIVAVWGLTFPKSRDLSAAARAHGAGPDPRDDADGALMAWIAFEEALFRRLERRILAAQLHGGLSAGPEPDVDAIYALILSAANRRKSRMGLSLENHVEEVLKRRGIRHERGARTENTSRPDFLFPSAAAYQDLGSDPQFLTMLGVKSTLKDRWRQILAEASRIDRKHLLTLEPGISTAQTAEIARHKVQLVVPKAIHTTFSVPQTKDLMTFDGFIDLVRDRQNHTASRL